VHENVNLANVFNRDDVFDGMASLDSVDFIAPIIPLFSPCPLTTTTTTIIIYALGSKADQNPSSSTA
jgi:hypothetical protein